MIVAAPQALGRKPISEPTLRRAFRREIDSGQTELTTLVGNMLVSAVVGREPAYGAPIKSDTARIHAENIFRRMPDGLASRAPGARP